MSYSIWYFSLSFLAKWPSLLFRMLLSMVFLAYFFIQLPLKYRLKACCLWNLFTLNYFR